MSDVEGCQVGCFNGVHRLCHVLTPRTCRRQTAVPFSSSGPSTPEKTLPNHDDASNGVKNCTHVPARPPIEALWQKHQPRWLSLMPRGCRDAWLHGFGVLRVRILEARGMVSTGHVITDVVERIASDLYAELCIDGQTFQTHQVKHTLSPCWNEEFEFKVRDPYSKLKVTIYDVHIGIHSAENGWLFHKYERGSCEFEVQDLVPGNVYNGWLPLLKPSEEDLSNDENHIVGGLRFSVQLEVPSQASLCWLYITGVPDTNTLEPEDPSFNLDDLYSPGMMLVEIFWTRFLSPWIFGVLDVLKWTDPKSSMRWCLAYLTLPWWYYYLPAFLFLRLAHFMWECRHPNSWYKVKNLRRFQREVTCIKNEERHKNQDKKIKGHKHLENKRKTVLACKLEDQHLSGVILMVAGVLPAWIQDWLRGYQPTLTWLAVWAVFLHDMLTWAPDSTAAPGLFGLLVVTGILLLVVPVCYTWWIYVLFVFHVTTPVFQLELGLLWYCLRKSPSSIPSLRSSYDPAWKSYLDLHVNGDKNGALQSSISDGPDEW